jgi:chromate transporter
VNQLLYFLLNVKASLLSTGGLGNVPSLHADLIRRSMATEKQFAAALAVGQLSPGPNGMWVVALGFGLGGLSGALISLLAICVPAGLVLVIRSFYKKHKDHAAVNGFIWGLTVAMVIEFGGTMANLVHNVKPFWLGATVASIAFLVSLRTKLPVVLIIGIAAIAGLLFKP